MSFRFEELLSKTTRLGAVVLRELGGIARSGSFGLVGAKQALEQTGDDFERSNGLMWKGRIPRSRG